MTKHAAAKFSFRQHLYLFWFFIKNFISSFFPQPKNTFTIDQQKFGKILCFSIDSEEYKIVIPRGKKRSPPTFYVETFELQTRVPSDNEVHIIVNHHDDIEKISPFLGPNNDFFSSSTQWLEPRMIGIENMVISTHGNRKIFQGCDPIVV